MEKTIESLQRVLIGGTGSSSRSILPLIGTRKRFDEFVYNTRFAFSKHEEDVIVKNKLTALQNHLSQPGISLDEVEDCLLYAMYCETIGYSCPFAYIHSLKLAEQGNLHQKMIGYLAAIVFLHQQHELVVLLINTIQKGVKSSNVIEICLALNAVCHLVSSDMVPSVQCLIEEKLNHPHPLVRHSAILALQHCLMQSQNWHISLAALPKIEKALMDRDLSVVTSAVTVLKELIKKEPKKFIHLIPSLIHIQDQLIHRKISKDFEYHTIPSPWLQIQILRILAVLGRFEKESVNKIYQIVKETLQRAEVSQNIAYAITFECIEAIVELQQDSDEVLQVALSSVTKLLKSKCANLKFMGIKALSHVAIKIHPQFATQHQEIVMECLHHPDSSMRLQTLDLLYAMANPSNVQVICRKMLEYLEACCDAYTHQIIVDRIAELAVHDKEQNSNFLNNSMYCSDDSWLITTANSLFFLAPDNVPGKVLHQLIERIKTGSDKLKLFAVQTYSELCEKSKLPFQLIQLASWVLGETWSYSTAMDSYKAQNSLCNLLEKQENLSEETHLWILSALLKIILSTGIVSDQVKLLAQNLAQNVKFKSVQQKACEMSRIVDNLSITLPLFAQCSVKKVDPTLSFLDAFICEELEKGALPYKLQSAPKPTCFPCLSVKDESDEHCHFHTASSPVLHSGPHSIVHSPSYQSLGSGNLLCESPLRMEHVSSRNVWTKEGRLQSHRDDILSTSSSSVNQSNSDEQVISEQEELCKELFAGIADTVTHKKDSTKEDVGSKMIFVQKVNTSATAESSFSLHSDCSSKAQQFTTKSDHSSVNIRTNTYSEQSRMSLLEEFARDIEIQLENNRKISNQHNREPLETAVANNIVDDDKRCQVSDPSKMKCPPSLYY